MSDAITDVERLVVTDAVREVMARYVYLADHKEFGDLAALFAADATFAIYGAEGEQVLTLNGPAEIEQTITRSVGASQAIHHLFSYTVEAHSATAASGVFNMEDLILAGSGS